MYGCDGCDGLGLQTPQRLIVYKRWGEGGGGCGVEGGGYRVVKAWVGLREGRGWQREAMRVRG